MLTFDYTMILLIVYTGILPLFFSFYMLSLCWYETTIWTTNTMYAFNTSWSYVSDIFIFQHYSIRSISRIYHLLSSIYFILSSNLYYIIGYSWYDYGQYYCFIQNTYHLTYNKTLSNVSIGAEICSNVSVNYYQVGFLYIHLLG